MSRRLPLAQQWLDKHGIEPVTRKRFEAFLEENPAIANVQSDTDKEELFRQFEAWDAVRNARAEVGSKTGESREREQAVRSAMYPSRRPLRRTPPAKVTIDTSSKQRAVTECEKNSRRGRADSDGCHRASEDAWSWKRFSGSTQDISTSDRPPSDLSDRRSIPNTDASRP
jgi:hypothetical protein